MTATTTKDGITVEPGQIWRDLDKRMTNRHCKVSSVRDGKAIMILCTENGRIINAMREVIISIGRMHKSSTGWALVRDSNGNVIRPIEAEAN